MIPRLFVYAIFFVCGGILPIYWSHQALKSGDEKEMSKWLIHWMIFTLYLKFLCVSNALIGVWLPFYNEIILLVFFWLTSPCLNGGVFLYQSYLSPLLTKYEDDIEANLQAFVAKSLKLVVVITSKAANFFVSCVSHILKEGNITLFNSVHGFQVENNYGKNINSDYDSLPANQDPGISDKTEATTGKSLTENKATGDNCISYNKQIDSNKNEGSGDKSDSCIIKDNEGSSNQNMKLPISAPPILQSSSSNVSFDSSVKTCVQKKNKKSKKNCR